MIKAVRRNLVLKIILLGVFSVLAMAVALLIAAYWQSSQYTRMTFQSVEQLSDVDLDHLAGSVYQMVKAQDEAVQQQMDANLNVARYVLLEKGGPNLGSERAEWTAVNQLTQEKVMVQLPYLQLGDLWLGQNDSLSQETPLVDDVQKMVGGAVTVFQKMDPQGDMLRVATTVQTKDGKRAVGTFIPAANDDGSQNPVIAAILRGESYHGRAQVMGEWYVSAYEPLVDANGELLGMLFVGVKQENVKSLRQAINGIKVGKTGYVFVLGGKGDMQGHYIISQGGIRDGENVWDSKDSQGNHMIQSIIKKALQLQPGGLATEKYLWQNPGEEAPRVKIARIAYYEPWDWVIGVSVYEDELTEYQTVLESGQRRMMGVLALASLVVALLVVVLFIILARSIVGPVRQLAQTASALSQGEVELEVAHRSEDELGQLADAFRSVLSYLAVMAGTAGDIADCNLAVQVQPRSLRDALGTAFERMVASLRSLIGDTVQNTDDLHAASGELSEVSAQAGKATSQIAATMQDVARGAAQQADSISQTARAVENMNEVISGVSKGARRQAESVDQAAELTNQLTVAARQVTESAAAVSQESSRAAQAAQRGTQTVRDTIQGMQSIQEKVGASAAKVQEMGERSSQIGTILETISDIASQTNLLALNAAIEAARAGESGKGFAVVADEVRKLAERSARATQEISVLIRGIQFAVDDAINAMHAGAGEVETGVGRAREAGNALEDIISAVEGVHSQAEVAARAAQQMDRATSALTGAVSSVLQVTGQNEVAAQQMVAGSEEVSRTIEAIASISQQTSAAVEEVSAASEELHAQVQRVAESAQSLAKLAQSLQVTVNRFTLE